MDERKNSLELNFDLYHNGKRYISNVESSRLEVLVDRLKHVDNHLDDNNKILNGVETIVMLEVDDAKGFRILDHISDLFPRFMQGAQYFEDFATKYEHHVGDCKKVGFRSTNDSPFKNVRYRTKDEGSSAEKISRKAALGHSSLLSEYFNGHVNLHDIYAFSIVVADADLVENEEGIMDNPHRIEAIRRLKDCVHLDLIDSEIHNSSSNYSAFHGTYMSNVQGAEKLLFEVQIYTESEWEQTRDGNTACHLKYKESKFNDPHSDEGYQIVIFSAEDGLHTEYHVNAVTSPFVRKAHVIKYDTSLDLQQLVEVENEGLFS